MFDIHAYLRGFSSSSPVLLMGILNLTPDSFHDGGAYVQRDAALSRLRFLQAAGAQILDLGAMSSRPGHSPVSAEEEISRLSLLLSRPVEQAPLLSVDTDKPEVAAYALEHGVGLINDCSGLLQRELYILAARWQVPLVVMHRMGQEGQHGDICREVLDFFRESLSFGKSLGLSEQQFIFDPGLGFNKNYEENLELMKALPAFCGLGRPILLGFSHKRFISHISGEEASHAPGGNL
ncbi:MAG: dihydropteroate synthase, partial [Bacillota bacterium]|nr:dihydropteroate synthase [Bacillota bacterium]